MKLIAWAHDTELNWEPHFVEPDSDTTACGLVVEHRCRHDEDVAEVKCTGCTQTTHMTIKLPEGWHDLSLEERLVSLFAEVGLGDISVAQVKKAVDNMEKGPNV